jgi:hypothetical protein
MVIRWVPLVLIGSFGVLLIVYPVAGWLELLACFGVAAFRGEASRG